jgi:hypothetical protein
LAGAFVFGAGMLLTAGLSHFDGRLRDQETKVEVP